MSNVVPEKFLEESGINDDFEEQCRIFYDHLGGIKGSDIIKIKEVAKLKFVVNKKLEHLGTMRACGIPTDREDYKKMEKVYDDAIAYLEAKLK